VVPFGVTAALSASSGSVFVAWPFVTGAGAGAARGHLQGQVVGHATAPQLGRVSCLVGFGRAGGGVAAPSLARRGAATVGELEERAPEDLGGGHDSSFHDTAVVNSAAVRLWSRSLARCRCAGCRRRNMRCLVSVPSLRTQRTIQSRGALGFKGAA
jgi:hypothetical protein